MLMSSELDAGMRQTELPPSDTIRCFQRSRLRRRWCAPTHSTSEQTTNLMFAFPPIVRFKVVCYRFLWWSFGFQRMALSLSSDSVSNFASDEDDDVDYNNQQQQRTCSQTIWQARSATSMNVNGKKGVTNDDDNNNNNKRRDVQKPKMMYQSGGRFGWGSKALGRSRNVLKVCDLAYNDWKWVSIISQSRLRRVKVISLFRWEGKNNCVGVEQHSIKLSLYDARSCSCCRCQNIWP